MSAPTGQPEFCEGNLCSLSSLPKSEFLKVINNLDEAQVRQLYIQVLIGIEKTVLDGTVNRFKQWNKIIKYISEAKGKKKLLTYYKASENPFRDTNFIILSCKHIKIEFLRFLFGNTNEVITNIFSNTGNILPNNQDEEYHTAFYYAIRSGNIELLEILISKWPKDYFDSRSEELEDILSMAIEELMLKNVPLSEEMEYYVQDKLINLRFFAKDSEDYKPSHSKIIERIDLVLEIFDFLKTKYSNEEVDQRFIFINRFIAQNIHVLKRQLKSTYIKLPWEEIEFCLISFVSSYIRDQEINLYYCSVLNRKKLLYHLENFFSKLELEKMTIKCTDVNDLAKLPNLKREKVIDGIIAYCSLFESLYSDYKEIRDIYSLQKINAYINLALSVDCSEKEGQLIIMRTLQVIGEHLKNTLESPKLSSTISELLILSTPNETREILIDLRNSLSHSYSLGKRFKIEEKSDHTFYKTIQKDIQKISTVINDIFYSTKIKIIKILLNKIIKSQNFEGIKEVIEIFQTINIELTLLAASNYFKNDYGEIEKIIKELNDVLPEKTSYEEKLFNELKDIFNVDECKIKLSSGDIKTTFIESILSLKTICDNLSFYNANDNIVRREKFFAKKALANFTTHGHGNRMRNVWKILMNIFNSVKLRLVDPLNEIWGLFYIIFYTTFEENQIKGIEDLREKLNKINFGVTKSKKMKNIKTNENFENQIDHKIMEMENIIRRYEELNKKSDLKPTTLNCKAKLQVAIEILLLDIISAVERLGVCFLNNNLFLDEYFPLLNGKCLRNHLAHGNSLIDILLNDPSIAVLANAKLYSNKAIIKNKIIGKLIDDDPSNLREKFDRDLELLTNQKHMFAALEEENLEEVKKCLQKGADINARDLNLWTALHYAAKNSNLQIVKFVLVRNPNFELKDKNGDTPLHIAATYRRSHIVEYFLKYKECPVDITNKYGNTPLHIASLHGHQDTVRILIDYKAKLHKMNIFGCSSLFMAAQRNHLEIVKIILEKGININYEAKGGFTPLHAAAENGHLELVNFLLDNKANVNAKNDKGCIPLHTAAFFGYVDIVKTLISKGANVNAQMYDGYTALHYAAENGQADVVRILLDHGANVDTVKKTDNYTPLHYAAQNGYRKTAEILLQRGANVNLVTSENFAPLHLAAAAGHRNIVQILILYMDLAIFESQHCFSALHLSAANNHRDVTEILIRNGVDINRKDENGDTSLHLSSRKGHGDVVETLISKGADINDLNSDGITPLHCSIINNDKDVIKLLIKNGADIHAKDSKDRTYLHVAAINGCTAEMTNTFANLNVNAMDRDNFTPLHLAAICGNNNVVEILIKIGANIDYNNKDNITPLHCAVVNNHKDVTDTLIKYGTDVNIKDINNLTALCYAVKCKNKEVVELLIKKGADVNVENGKPLSMAAFLGHKGIVNALVRCSDTSVNTLNAALHSAILNGSTSIVKVLVSKGADVNFLFALKATLPLSPLYLSASKGHKDIVKFLIANGVQVNAKSTEGDTPLHVAAANGHWDVIKILINNAADVHVRDSENITPLECAVGHCHLQVVQILLQHKDVNINAKGTDDWTLLHISAREGNLEISEYLVNMGADINAKDSYGSMPLHIAAGKGHKDIVEYFLNKGNNVNDQGSFQWTSLHYASAEGRYEVVKYLINKKIDVNTVDRKGLRSIHYAASFGCRDTTELLINNGAYFDDVEKACRKIFGITESNVLQLLMITENLFEAVEVNKPLEVESCIKKGACINAKRTKKDSPLHLATWKGFEEVVDILLKNKANPNTVDQNGCIPLHYASKFNYLKIVIILLSHGAIYNFKNFNGKTPLDLANNKEIKKLLTLTSDSFKSVQNGDSKFINDLKMIKDVNIIKAVANACNKDNKSLIFFAIHNDFPNLKHLRQIVGGNYVTENYVAELFISQEKYEEALNIYHLVLEKTRALFGSDSLDILDIQSKIAAILYKKGKYQEALTIYEDIYMKHKKILGLNNEDTLHTRSCIALILHRLGEDKKAIDIFKDVAAKQEELLGRSHLDTLVTKFHMALVLDRLGKYEEALNINNEVYEKRKENLGMNDPVTLSAYNNVAMVLSNQGKHEEALKIYRNVFERRKIVLGPVHSDTLRVLHSIGVVLRYLKKNDESLKIHQEVLDIQSNILGSSHPDTLFTSYNIGNLLFSQGKCIAALKAFTEGLDRTKTVFGPNHPIVVETEKKLGYINFVLKLENIDTTNVLGNIQTAVASGDIKMIETLLKQMTEINFSDNEGRTLLHFAAHNGHKDIVKLLLNNKADATKATNKGNTVLHTATNKGYREIVDSLLQHVKQFNYDNFNDFINARTSLGGTTALHVAAKNGSFEIVKLLLIYGAIYDITDQKNNRPLHLSEQQDVIEILQLTEETFKCAEEGNIRIIKKLKEKFLDVASILNARNSQGQTSIQVVFISNHKDLGRTFLKMLQ